MAGRRPIRRVMARVGCGLLAFVLLSAFAYAVTVMAAFFRGECREDRSEERRAAPPRPPARAVPGGGAAALSLSGESSCARMHDGSVYCWGHRSIPMTSQTSDATAPDRSAISVSLGASGLTCETKGDGGARCWFAGETVRDYSAVAPPPALSFERVVAGHDWVCGMESSGPVACWNAGKKEIEQPRLPGVVDIGLGVGFVCGRTATGDVLCDDLGGASARSDPRIGRAPLRSCSRLVVSDFGICCEQAGDQVACVSMSGEARAMALPSAATIAAGGEGACALSRAHEVWCWTVGPQSIGDPQKAATVGDALQLAVYDRAGCAREDGGKVRCWGGAALPVGVGGEVSARAADSSPVPGVLDASDVVVGSTEVCLRRAAEGWRCWSRRPVPATEGVSAPKLVVPPGSAQDFAASEFAQCTVNDGVAHCQRGSALPPGPATIDVTGATRVVVGMHHACITRNGGELWCFGANESGQIADDRSPTFAAPILSASEVESVALGRAHTCALHTDHTVRCWGDNLWGQLGMGTTSAMTTRSPVQGLVGPAVQIAAGNQHTCALLASGKVVCWGANGSGQLGDGTMRDHATACEVRGLDDDVHQVAAAGDWTCAITRRGRVFCWGDVLRCTKGGRDACRAVAEPIGMRVEGADDAVEIAVGDLHACLRRRDGAVACWGDNRMHQISSAMPLIERRVPVGRPGCTAIEEVEATSTDRPTSVVW